MTAVTEKEKMLWNDRPGWGKKTGSDAANRAKSRTAQKCRKEKKRRKAKDKHAAPTALTFTQQGKADRVRVPASLASSNAWELTRYPFCRNASAFMQKFGTSTAKKQNESARCFFARENGHENRSGMQQPNRKNNFVSGKSAVWLATVPRRESDKRWFTVVLTVTNRVLKFTGGGA